VLLSRAGWLWNLNSGSQRAGLPGSVLEWVFLAAAALIATGGLFWVVQALEGLRRAQPGNARGSSRAAWTAGALLVTLMVSCFAFRPDGVARNLDQQAFSLEAGGYRVIPVLMTCAATRLDPSHPEYALHTVNLYEMSGQTARAERARAKLDRQLSPYVNTLRREGWHP